MIKTEEDRLFVEELYFRYRNLLFTIAYKRLHNEALSEDAVMETFIKAIDNLHHIDRENPTRARNYLATICQNIVTDMLRKMGKNPVVSIDDEDFGDVTDDYSDPQDMVISKEAVSIIEDAIINLDPKYKEPLILRRINKMSIDEISQTLDISKEAVNKRILRAKYKLKEQLEVKEVIKK